MKDNFTFYNPTKIYFGKNSIKNLKQELEGYGKNILLAYGGGSIKRNGIYDEVIDILKACNKNIFEFSGIMPNPTLDKLLEGKRLCEENQIDLILAIGGGSVIDCAKGVSASAYIENPWEKFWLNNEECTHSIPVGTILTMVGTGSEANGGSVITNEETKKKKGHVFGANVFPKFSILDPTYTYTVSRYQMCSGIFDILSHLMEQYFSGDDDNVSDYLLEGLMRSVINSTKDALKNQESYEARSNIMWAATLALNTLVGKGKDQDWEVHSIEHQISAYTDCSHGMGLSAISPNYYRHIYKYGLGKFYRYAVNVFNVNPAGKSVDEVALEGIKCLEKFIKESEMVTNLKELGCTKEMLIKIAVSSDIETTSYKIMTADEIYEILLESYEG